MIFRLAKMNDLECIKVMYKQIVKDMKKNNLDIWDEIYPCNYLAKDIKNKSLYILENDGEIVSAFALVSNCDGNNHVSFKDSKARYLYIDRLGVNAKFLRQGIGSIMLNKACQLAKEKGAEYLRLFVIDINKPAINLYINNGFVKADGIYDEVVDDELTLHEYGFEKEM